MDQLNINPQISTIERLRRNGYSKNYTLNNDQSIRCLDDDNCYNYDRAIIRLVNHDVDMSMNQHGLIFMVETINGDKGLMALPLKGVKKRVSRKSKESLIEAIWLSL